MGFLFKRKIPRREWKQNGNFFEFAVSEALFQAGSWMDKFLGSSIFVMLFPIIFLFPGLATL